MSENLGSFLVDLASDADALARFMADPRAVLRHAHLSRDEKAALAARDSRRVMDAFGDTLHAMGQAIHTDKAKKKPRRPAPKKKKAPARPGRKKR
jgi:hypothetical protein